MTSPTTFPSLTGNNDSPAAPTVPDEDHGVDLPMSMTASVILTNLPRDASQALADVEALDDRKGMNLLLPSCHAQPLLVGSSRITSLRFSTVVICAAH